MSNKKSIFIFICIFVAILYLFFVRDWYKPSFIDKHWIECTVEKINAYDDLSEICNDLIKDGNFFKIDNIDDLSDEINVVNGYFDFSIVSNDSFNKGYYNIATDEDLDLFLDNEFGEFRPVFNLMSRKYSYERGSCWISPNLKVKNEYGFTEDKDEIMVVIFCEKFTITIRQSGWGGDQPFQRFFLLFYELLK